MKKIVIGMMLLGSISVINAQKSDLLFIAKLSKDEVPKNIQRAIKGNFPKLEVTEIIAIPFRGTAPSKINPIEGYDDYTVMFKGKTSKIMATYNKDGELLNTVDHYKYKTVSMPIRLTIADAYPDWVILDGYKKFTSYSKEGNIKNEKFKITIENGDKRKKIFADASGNITKGLVKF